MDLADTPFVTLLHADDLLLPNYTESMLKVAKSFPDAAFYFCNATIIDENGNKRFSFPDYVKKWIQPRSASETIIHGDDGLAALLEGCFIMCPTICYQKSKIAGLKFDITRKQVLDLHFYAQLLFRGQRLIGIKEDLYLYRRHEENQTSKLTLTLTRFEEEIGLYRELYVLSSEKKWPKTMSVAKKQTIIKLNLGYCVVTDLLKGAWKPALNKLKLLWSIS